MITRRDKDGRDFAVAADSTEAAAQQDSSIYGGRIMDAPTDMNAFIGKGSEFVGKLTFQGTVRIDGRVEGEIFSKGTLIIGQGAEIKAKINVETVIISGTISGNITANKMVELRAPGRLYGNIRTPALQMEKGVIFEGNCKMENLDKAGDFDQPRPPQEAEAPRVKPHIKE